MISFSSMKLVAFLCVIISFIQVIILQEEENLSYPTKEALCPPWFIYDSSLDQCVCSSKGSDHVKCTEQGALLRFGSCMTVEQGNKTVVARCQYYLLCINEHNVTVDRYIVLPDDIAELNDYVCGPMNRKGIICSECIEGFGPSLTSLSFQCTDCTNAWYGVPLFLFLELVPVTILYLIIFFFRISLASAPMTAFVLYSQLAVYAVSRVDAESRSIMQLESPYGYRSMISLISFYSIWNLDFFRFVLPQFCISPRLRIINVVILSYLSAFYPLFLIGISYMCTKFSVFQCKPTLFLQSKVQKYFLKSKRAFNIKNSIVDVFASFLLLSSTKLMLIFSTFLGSTRIINVDGTVMTTRLGVDPSVLYFGTEHIPYFFFATFSLIGPVLISALLLTLYPIKSFRSVLLKLRIGGHLKAALSIFVEKFHSCYRDGLGGGRDMRSFAGFYFLVRALALIIAAFLPAYKYGIATWVTASTLFGGSGILIAVVRPYKKAYMNVIDALLLFNMSVLSAIFSQFFASINNPKVVPYSPAFVLWSITIIGCIPMFGFAVYVIVKFVKWSKRVSLWLKFKQCCTYKRVGETDPSVSARQNEINGDLELPDRFLHPEEYLVHSDSV